LFFCACVDTTDNELAYLEAIHFFVEVLDQFFGNVCELDLVFNFYKVRGDLFGRLSGADRCSGVDLSEPHKDT
jgi:AP-2 complex subunit sigma-1